MKSKSLILMVVSLGFGLVAAVGISQVMGRGSSDQSAMRTGTVVVPLEELSHNVLLSEENCKLVDYPVHLIPEGAVTNMENIQDMATKGRMLKEMPIVQSSIIHKNKRGQLAIPKGQKVVSIKVSAADVIDGLLKPGDHVDVVGIFKMRRQDKDLTTAKTFLKNITVFAVAGKVLNDGERKAGGAKNNSIVSVLVTPQQAEMLILVQQEAHLTLTLRGEMDSDDPEGVADEDFLANFFKGIDDFEEEQPQEKGGSMADLMRDALSRDSNHGKKTMRIWEGSEPITFTFGGQNDVPTSDRGSRPEAPLPLSPGAQTDPAGSNDYTRPEGIDRSLEEDQYPGE